MAIALADDALMCHQHKIFICPVVTEHIFLAQAISLQNFHTFRFKFGVGFNISIYKCWQKHCTENVHTRLCCYLWKIYFNNQKWEEKIYTV